MGSWARRVRKPHLAGFSRGAWWREAVTSPVESVEGGLLSLGRAGVGRWDPGPKPCPSFSFFWEGRWGFSGAQLGEATELQLCDPCWIGVPGPLEQPGRESDLTWGADGTGEL